MDKKEKDKDIETPGLTIRKDKDSEWKCCLFGGNGYDGIVWVPKLGNEPNWFWRLMQYLIFGNKWIKNND